MAKLEELLAKKGVAEKQSEQLKGQYEKAIEKKKNLENDEKTTLSEIQGTKIPEDIKDQLLAQAEQNFAEQKEKVSAEGREISEKAAEAQSEMLASVEEGLKEAQEQKESAQSLSKLERFPFLKDLISGKVNELENLSRSTSDAAVELRGQADIVAGIAADANKL